MTIISKVACNFRVLESNLSDNKIFCSISHNSWNRLCIIFTHYCYVLFRHHCWQVFICKTFIIINNYRHWLVLKCMFVNSILKPASHLCTRIGTRTFPLKTAVSSSYIFVCAYGTQGPWLNTFSPTLFCRVHTMFLMLVLSAQAATRFKGRVTVQVPLVSPLKDKRHQLFP